MSQDQDTTLPRDFTLLEVADALDMSERWLRQQIKAGAEHLRKGHKIAFTERQVEKLRESLTVNGSDETASSQVRTGRSASRKRVS